MSRQITHDEVKKHADQKSTWIIIHHDVYDVTKFLDEHPGGADSLLEYAGIDGTQAFEDVAHSEDAREMMKKYKIGTIPENERTSPEPTYGFVPLSNRKLIVLPASGNDCCDPKNVSKKMWRNFDGAPIRSGESGGSGPSLPGAPPRPCGECSAPRAAGPCGVCEGPAGKLQRTEPRCKAIVVPATRHSSSSSTLKWALVALAGAIIIGIAVKKYTST